MNDQQSRSGRRLDAYIRVSQVAGREGDSFISPHVQEERIRAWALASGHEIIAAHHELDVSGGTMDRPLLNEVMRRIDASETDGVVVFNLSRFARTLKGSIELIERINAQGALFGSVQDNFDITTVNGRMVMNILLSIAQAERERSKENYRTGRAEAVSRGIHISPPVFGYVRGRGPVNAKTGRPAPAPLEVDPVTGSIVTEIFQRRAAGESFRDIRNWLNGLGVPTVRGAPWSYSAIQHIIRNKTYLGVASGGVGGDFADGIPGAHPALVDEATWQAAQERIGARAGSSRECLVVSRGLVRCASCRFTAATRTHRDGSWRMVCHRNQNNGDCPAPVNIVAVSPVADRIALDDFIIEQMWARLERIEFEALDEGLDVTEEEHEIAALEAKREMDADDRVLEASLSRPAWMKHLAGLTAQIVELEARRAEKLRLAGRRNRPVKELRADWESGDMPMADKRALMGSVIKTVFVRPSRPMAVNDPELRRQRLLERTWFVWVGDGPNIEIPRQGVPGFKPRPFVFPTDSHPDDAGEASL